MQLIIIQTNVYFYFFIGILMGKVKSVNRHKNP